MMKKLIYGLMAVLLLTACTEKAKKTESGKMPQHQNEPGDSTCYGLACDGTSDSLLILLPIEGGNPDTFNIIIASQERKIYGRPRIGDELAVILSAEDSTVAQMVINIERLKGDWHYQVMPKFRRLENLDEKQKSIRLAQIPDSVKKRLLVPREYGIQLKRGNIAQTVGLSRNMGTDGTSPVEYPKAKRYSSWKLFNGKLILITDTARMLSTTAESPLEHDTAEIKLLGRDSLVLQFKDHEQSYYRKKDSIK